MWPSWLVQKLSVQIQIRQFYFRVSTSGSKSKGQKLFPLTKDDNRPLSKIAKNQLKKLASKALSKQHKNGKTLLAVKRTDH
jgi:hypothetical protein